MKIAIVGTGYVGLVTGTCFSEMGIDVTCIDVDNEKINLLKQGVSPIYEPGLEELIKRNYDAGRLHFTSDLALVINDVDVIFIAVGTPPDEDGNADLRYVLEVAETIGKHMTKYVLVVTKSTVPVGTSQRVKARIQEELSKRKIDLSFDIASNPEFLKEGSAVADFMSPDRIVVGVESEKAREIMDKLYKPFTINNYRTIFTDIPSAEMIKYAANAMLATRISFMNDIANLCDLLGADVNMVRRGIGADSRIGNKFLYPGCGYGGSCFPKDIKALIKTADESGYNMKVLKAVEEVNDNQKKILYKKLNKHYKDFNNRTIAIWGLSFKPETDDIREAPALTLIEELLNAGAKIKTFDPVAMHETRKKLGDTVIYCDDMYQAAENADALVLVTEWKTFRMPNWIKLKAIMNKTLIIDGRNIYDKYELTKMGFEYEGI